MIAGLLGLVLGFLGSMPVAGPIALLVLRKGLKAKYREGVSLALGASIPEAVYCGMALFGFDFLFVRFPLVAHVTQILAGALLIILGIVFIRMKPTAETEVPGMKRQRKATPLITGFLVAAMNPTLIITWSGVAAVVYSTFGTFTTVEKVLFPIGVGTGNLLWFVLLLWLMKRNQQRVGFQTIRTVTLIFGTAIVLLGVWLLVRAVMA